MSVTQREADGSGPVAGWGCKFLRKLTIVVLFL